MNMEHNEIINFLKSRETDELPRSIGKNKQNKQVKNYEIDISQLLKQQQNENTESISESVESYNYDININQKSKSVKFHDLFEEASKSLTEVALSHNSENNVNLEASQSVQNYQIDKLTDQILQLQDQLQANEQISCQTLENLKQQLAQAEIQLCNCKSEVQQYKKNKISLEQKLCLVRAECDLKIREVTCQYNKLENQKESRLTTQKVRDLQSLNKDLSSKLANKEDFIQVLKSDLVQIKIDLQETKKQFLTQFKEKEIESRLKLTEIQNQTLFLAEKSNSIELTDNAQNSVIHSLKQENQSLNQKLQDQQKQLHHSQQQLKLYQTQVLTDTQKSQLLIQEMKNEFDKILKQNQLLETQQQKAITLLKHKLGLSGTSLTEMLQKLINNQYMK